MQNVKDFCRGLRTYRRFSQESLPDEFLFDLADCARMSSSGMNAQPLRFTLVNSAEKVAGMQDLVKFAAALPPELGTPKPGEQPVAFIVISKTAKAGAFSDIDAGIAAHAITSAAWAFGVGSTILCNIKKEEIRSLTGVPADEEIRMVIALGKPSVKSTLVEVPESGSLSYYLDEDRNYYVPKLSLDTVARLV